MRSIRLLFFGHLAALAFGLGGLLIALPNPELWAGSRYGGQVFDFGMRYAGSLHIVLGALTMLAFGGRFIGWRRTSIFFVVTVVLSLSSELIGTGTGWPFGNYAYTDGLGFKVFGRVPFTIPLSWFYVGFASYLLANVLVESYSRRFRAALTVAGGAYLLTVWDLVLDPAMAHEAMPVQFWTWFETGPYFGMPAKNFVGWAVTAILFMGISRLLWRRDIAATAYPVSLPFGIYLANMLFAMALSLSVGLWEPAVAAVAFGLVPAAFAWRSQPPAADSLVRGGRHGSAATRRPAEPVARRTIMLSARAIASRRLELAVEGLEHLPASGPALLACRHYHHLYDGCALIASISRPIHILVALDWIENALARRLMEWACRTARWPVVLRTDRLGRQQRAAYRLEESRRIIRQGVSEAISLLRAGEVLVVFPEGYPNVDPSYTPKRDDEFLPFRPGFVRIAELAQGDGVTRVPIIPVGFAYQEAAGGRWQVTMRLGAPVFSSRHSSKMQLVKVVEDRVRLLSEPGPVLGSAIPREAVQS